jgi:anti-sigma B factor antagonist
MKTHVALEHPDVLVVSLDGDVDVATAPAIDDCVDAALRANRRSITIDLAGVTFMDSQGLNALLRAWRALKAIDGEFRLRAPSAPAALVLALSGVDQQLTVVSGNANGGSP